MQDGLVTIDASPPLDPPSPSLGWSRMEWHRLSVPVCKKETIDEEGTRRGYGLTVNEHLPEIHPVHVRGLPFV